ncbi:pyridoxal-phosphate dependent enzyme [Hoeflea sp. 108]|uniref:threonine synthase n=1 Tax=Hoeflea sp. 108 TaxID=1116369 RepID=UPI0024753082|nr:pyridoxal-phosphate dependent enzyme [Hoeflea sp. 108]
MARFDRIEEQQPSCETIALSIGTTRSTYQAVKALRDTGGLAVCVSNEQLLRMQRKLAIKEGLFVELASAAPLVAIQQLREKQTMSPNDRVVAVATASGLKDFDVSMASADSPVAFDRVEDAWGWLSKSVASKKNACLRLSRYRRSVQIAWGDNDILQMPP